MRIIFLDDATESLTQDHEPVTLKEQSAVLRKTFLIRTDWLFLLPEQTKLSSFSWLNKQTDLKGHMYTVLLCLHVADPATCLASNSVPLYFPQLDYSLMEIINISDFV